MSATTIDPLGPEDRDGALWTGAALIVVALHVAVVATYLLLRPEPAQRAEAPAVDVTFVPAAEKPTQAAPEPLPAEPVPPVEQSNLAPQPDEPKPVQPTEPQAQAEPTSQPEPLPPPAALRVPEPPAPPAPPDEATITAPPPEVTEPPPPPPKPVTAPGRPAPKPAAEDDKAEKARLEKMKREKAEQQKEAKEKEARKLAQQRAAASQAQRMAAAPNAGAESEGARAGQANWHREVEDQIRRHAAYPADGGGASGTVRISVTIDRNGRLLSHRLAGSSGAPSLDRAAMAAVERAQPFPHFPPGMTQAQIVGTLPLHLRPR